MEISTEYKYIPAFFPEKVLSKDAWVLILSGKKLLIKIKETKYEIPIAEEIEEIPLEEKRSTYIGSYDGHECFGMRLSSESEIGENFEWVEMAWLTKGSGDPGLFLLAGAANHILHWSSMNQFCGRCGSKTEDKKDERAKICSACGNIIYPRISPAVITAVFRGNQILLAHNRNFREGLYSLIAGYVEPGESLEQSVVREIKEEVGINVKNIQYFGSQPWSFPDSLMMAFTAEYESGEIAVDNCEISDASWFYGDRLPEIPTTDSIAGKMIRWYQERFLNYSAER